MARIQCTEKLLKKLKNDDCNIEVAANKLGDWHANLLRFNRKEYVLFTHDITLYSICVSKTSKLFYKNLSAIFLENLISNLEHENLQQYIAVIARAFQEVQFVKTSNRSVIGTMNNMSRFIDFYLYDEGYRKC